MQCLSPSVSIPCSSGTSHSPPDWFPVGSLAQMWDEGSSHGLLTTGFPGPPGLAEPGFPSVATLEGECTGHQTRGGGVIITDAVTAASTRQSHTLRSRADTDRGPWTRGATPRRACRESADSVRLNGPCARQCVPMWMDPFTQLDKLGRAKQ